MGGKKSVVKALPDISRFKISQEVNLKPDFIVIASDGVFDKLSNADVGQAVRMTCASAQEQVK